MKNFWQRLAQEQKPFFCLAPMEDVTDIAFREMFVRYSKRAPISFKESETLLPSVTWLRLRLQRFLQITVFHFLFPDRTKFVMFTEFTPSDGLAFGDDRAQARLRAKLSYTEGQRPIVAQIYNSNPQRMEDAARLVQELGFDGVDINMGCPVNAVVKQVSGAALINHPELAIELMRAVRKGAPNIPLSVKTRIGYSSVSDMQKWIAKILAEKPDALTVHLRTRSQMSKVPAQWEFMLKIVKMRNKISPETILIGNGDVQSVEHGRKLANKYGCDGIMVGRGAYGKPDFFASIRQTQGKDNHPQTMPALQRSQQQSSGLGRIKEMSSKPKSCGRHEDDFFALRFLKIQMLTEHLELFDELLLKKEYKGYHVMKKHFKAYIGGWGGAKELRAKLMQTDSPEEAKSILQKNVQSV